MMVLSTKKEKIRDWKKGGRRARKGLLTCLSQRIFAHRVETFVKELSEVGMLHKIEGVFVSLDTVAMT